MQHITLSSLRIGPQMNSMELLISYYALNLLLLVYERDLFQPPSSTQALDGPPDVDVTSSV